MSAALVDRIRTGIGEPHRDDSFSSRRRAVRFKELLRRFPELHGLRVLDLGGTPDFWHAAPVRPAFVTTMNLDGAIDAATVAEDWLEHVVADACDPSSLEQCAGDYDLVVSNSLIEHVGGYQKRRELAEVIKSAAPSYWVQTPNPRFPIEPHYIAPGFHFLPTWLRARLVAHWPLAHERVYDVESALAQVLMIELVSTTELRHHFPGACFWHERLFGLSKSVVAVKKA